MNYLLYGSIDYLIRKEIKKFKDKISDITEFDLNDAALDDIINDAATLSLFSNERLIIVYNSYIFTSKKNQKVDTTELEKYLKNPNSNTTILFVVNEEKIDSRKKIGNLVKKIEFNDVSNINKIVLDMFTPYSINNDNLNFFIKRVGNNLNLLEQEALKLKTYKDNNKEITKEDIELITIETIDIDIFHLVDNIILNNKEKALESYYEMLKMGEEPIKIIVILANQLRLIYQVKSLSMMHYSIYDMMNLLGQKKYPIEKALDKARKFDSDKLLDLIYKLSLLDINIKSGKINKNIGLELFILEN